MVATDTVVGIVGAVLLVAVMAGVFAYEYNNPATADTMSDAGQKNAFASHYAGLNATDDIDGDGIPNYKDTDIDGDGVANANDTSVGVAIKVSGAVPMTASPMSTQLAAQAFTAGTGVEHILAFVNYTVPTPSPLPAAYSLQASLVDGSGQTVKNGIATTSGSSVSIKIDSEGADLVAGKYELRISMSGANPQAGSYSGVILVHYPSPGGAMAGMSGMSH